MTAIWAFLVSWWDGFIQASAWIVDTVITGMESVACAIIGVVWSALNGLAETAATAVMSSIVAAMPNEWVSDWSIWSGYNQANFLMPLNELTVVGGVLVLLQIKAFIAKTGREVAPI